MPNPKNPFKNKIMRTQFDVCVNAYNAKHKDLITSTGEPRRGNAVAMYFWRGFFGINRKVWDAESRKMIAWACYRAGELIRKLENDAEA